MYWYRVVRAFDREMVMQALCTTSRANDRATGIAILIMWCCYSINFAAVDLLRVTISCWFYLFFHEFFEYFFFVFWKFFLSIIYFDFCMKWKERRKKLKNKSKIWCQKMRKEERETERQRERDEERKENESARGRSGGRRWVREKEKERERGGGRKEPLVSAISNWVGEVALSCALLEGIQSIYKLTKNSFPPKKKKQKMMKKIIKGVQFTVHKNNNQ